MRKQPNGSFSPLVVNVVNTRLVDAIQLFAGNLGGSGGTRWSANSSEHNANRVV